MKKIVLVGPETKEFLFAEWRARLLGGIVPRDGIIDRSLAPHSISRDVRYFSTLLVYSSVIDALFLKQTGCHKRFYVSVA
jgi:hypothetical protein